MKMTLRKRLIISFAITGLLTFVVGILGWKGIQEVADSMEKRATLQSLSETFARRELDHVLWVRKVGEFQRDPTIDHLSVQMDHTQCAFGKWLHGEERTALGQVIPKLEHVLEAMEKPHHQLHESAIKIDALLKQGTEKRAEALRIFSNETNAILKQVQGVFDSIKPILDAEVLAVVQESRTDTRYHITLSLVTALAGLICAVAFGYWMSIRIEKPIQSVTESLSRGAERTSAAAAEVSAASQSLAEGASEQAASLEETSSSLEELSSMTKRNAENASRANALTRDARKAAETGVREMETMSVAMESINASSSEIAKIIKTIDEIAFQTNILALNAAVEAARAGEAGMGFAVVAEEVRNLAQRSATAARETGAKIDGAIQNTSRGVAINEGVARALKEIESRVRQVDELVSDVATASAEQSRGIDQLNIAVSQMDKVTQSTAANAEETASASEELSSQADSLRLASGTLEEMIQGRSQASQIGGPAKGREKSRGGTARSTGSGGRNRIQPALSPAVPQEVAAQDLF